MDVLTFEPCWAVNSEIIKQVTSSWSIVIQIPHCIYLLCWRWRIFLNLLVNFGRDTGRSLRFVDSPWWRVKLRGYSSWGITIMNTQAWPGGRCCERLPVEPRVACQGNYREARSIALMAGFEASLSYGVQVLRKRSHLRACERVKCKSVHNILQAGSVRTRCSLAWKWWQSC